MNSNILVSAAELEARLGDGHSVLCWLPDEELHAMEPVIVAGLLY